MKLKAFKQAVATRYVRAVLLACCCCCVALLLLRVWLRSRCPASCLRHQYARMQCTHIHRVSTYILYIDIRRYTSTAPAGCCARVERESFLKHCIGWLAFATSCCERWKTGRRLFCSAATCRSGPLSFAQQCHIYCTLCLCGVLSTLHWGRGARLRVPT